MIGLTSAPSAAGTPIVLGVNGNQAQLESAIGVKLYTHAFGTLSGPTKMGRFINIQSTVPWATVATATPGTPTYSDISRWATAIQAYGQPVMVSFHHEPEAGASLKWGTASDFIAAWQNFVTIFRELGVTNVTWVWTVTAFSFVVPSTDRRYAANWYPGDAYVDAVGADAYNWFGCLPKHAIKWQELSFVARGALNFATAQGKPLVIAEFGSAPDPADPTHRAQWLDNAHAFLDANAATIAGAFYFNRPDRTCAWQLTSSQDYDAFARIANDPTFAHR